MSIYELEQWSVYLELKAEQEQKAMKQAKMKAKNKGAR